MTIPESNQTSVPSNKFFYGYIVIAAAFFVMMVTIGIRYCFGIFLKPMIADFGWTRALTSGAFSLAWIIECGSATLMGGLTDKFGPRKAMTLCAILSGLGYLLMSMISDIIQLYVVYALLIGTGSSVMSPLVSTTARWFIKGRTLMTGIVICGVGIGAMIWPPIIEQLISIYHWRMTYIIISIFIIMIALVAAQFLKYEPAKVGQVALGDNQTDKERLEKRKEAFSIREAISTRQFWTLFIILICFGYAMMSIQTHLAPYATDLGISAATAATILGVMGGASVFGRILLGICGDKFGNKKTFILAWTLMLISAAWLMFTREAWGFYFFTIVYGIAYGGFSAQQSPMVAKLFGLASLGLIFGVVAIGFTFGAAIGPFVSGYIFDVTGSYQTAFLACIIITLLGLILSLLLTPTRIKFKDEF